MLGKKPGSFPGDLKIKIIIQLSGINQWGRAGLSFYLHRFLGDRVPHPAAGEGDGAVGRWDPLVDVGVDPAHTGFAGILQGGSDGGQVAVVRGSAGRKHRGGHFRPGGRLRKRRLHHRPGGNVHRRSAVLMDRQQCPRTFAGRTGKSNLHGVCCQVLQALHAILHFVRLICNFQLNHTHPSLLYLP